MAENVAQAPPADNRKWFADEPPPLSEDTRKLLEGYSRIPADEVLPHCYSIRDKAWAIHNYPCIGQWRFLDLSIGQHPLYPEVLSRMRSGEQIYLDLGCAFAQDVRRLVADGVDGSKCNGSDLRLDFIEMGYELFRDKDTLKSNFIAADIFDASSPLAKLEGSVDIIGASSFFHLFNWEEQKTVALRVAKLMRPQKNSLLVGRQVGNPEAGEMPRRDTPGTRYRHNAESWQRMWKEVGDEVSVRFEANGMSIPRTAITNARETGDSMMEFSVRTL